MEKLFLLVNNTKAEGGNYAIVWLPIPSTTREWSVSDKTSFEFFSNRLPWFSIRRPWSIKSTVINYIKQEWGFKEDPMMIVLNENGVVTNSNAMDMVWIWGQKAFPFSTSREMELWEAENWTLNLMTNGISPLLSELVRLICNNTMLHFVPIEAYIYIYNLIMLIFLRWRKARKTSAFMEVTT